jgi:hypothetical protein
MTSKAARLREACLDLLREHERDGALPTNGRFIFYELEQRGIIPKVYVDDQGRRRPRQPANDVSDALMQLRQSGAVPWEWIVDETREVKEWRFASSAFEYVADAAEGVRIDCWGGEPAPLIICEARSTKGVLERIAATYLCPITATNGQGGGFIVTSIAPLLSGNDRRVLYLGDCEADGPADSIENNTRRYIEEHAGREFDEDTWERVALTEQQVVRDDRLLGLAIEKVDRRYKPPRPYQAIECEAVGQVMLERLLRDRLDDLLPEPLDDVLEREQVEREQIIALMQNLGGAAT